MKENAYDKQSFFEKYGEMLSDIPGMKDELRRPMMLAVSATKA
ncbi:methyltransferase [Bacteroides reticulotermitis]|uniref:Uncharacterized protein n=1 Tax=Bacteroides reticulotermitis TaxID=1133319 RepID=A0A840CS23_9BACE|nr:methyltransferase [Bacteroides reticulotermitis]MBB4042700.1 hypothetical protein [Bacteroides reticulotermitis]